MVGILQVLLCIRVKATRPRMERNLGPQTRYRLQISGAGVKGRADSSVMVGEDSISPYSKQGCTVHYAVPFQDFVVFQNEAISVSRTQSSSFSFLMSVLFLAEILYTRNNFSR